MPPSNTPLNQSSLILYQTEDGRTRIQCRFEGETLWLTQVQLAELFETSVPCSHKKTEKLFEDTCEATASAGL